MSDRLFSLDEVPEVPLFREPRRSRGAAISDERLSHDYPPEWNRCPTCEGEGFSAASSDFHVQRGQDSIAQTAGQGGNWAKVTHVPTGATGYADGELSGVRNVEAAMKTVRKQLRARGIACPDCLGMGSLKARVRLEAGHRCVRCSHPYVPKGDAKMLGIEPTPYHWSRCDESCTHQSGLIRLPDSLDERARDEGFTIPFPTGESVAKGLAIEAEWRILTVHHLDGDKANLAWWNLAALCQRCHLEIQAKVVLERVYPHEHSDWFKPYAAGWYAHVYLGESLTRFETLLRMEELLDLERIPS